MAKRKKKSSSQSNAFSPTRYIKEKARTFPIEACWLNDDWNTSGLAQVLVVRKQPSGKFLFGVFLVDVFCLGVKDAYWNINQVESEMEELIENMEARSSAFNEVSYPFAHNLIFGAIAYAEDLGFAPHKDFQFAKYVLEGDDDEIELIEMEFGRNGKPFFIVGPSDNVPKILQTLERSVGRGNFDYMLGPGGD